MSEDPPPALRGQPSFSSVSGPWQSILLERYGPPEGDDTPTNSGSHTAFLVLIGPTDHPPFPLPGPQRNPSQTPHHLTLLPAGHPNAPAHDRAMPLAVVSLSGSLIRQAARHLYDAPDQWRLRTDGPVVDSLLHGLLLSLHTEAEQGYPGGRAEGHALATQIAAQVAHRHLSPKPGSALPTTATSKSRLRQTIAFLQEHATEPITLADLAARAGLSLFHFVRSFKQATGLSPHQYLIRCRVEHARHLLAATDLAGDDVARQCGFCSHSHLITHFKRVVRSTPKRFRLQLGTLAA